MTQYEIREDHEVDQYRPFQLIDVEDGSMYHFRFATREAAEAEIDSLARMSAGFAAFSNALYGSPESEHLQVTETTPKPEPVLPDEIILDSQEEVGTIIEYKGQQWLVTLCEYESEVTPVDARDEYDERLPIGWHSWLVKVQLGNKALLVVAELIKDGKATLNSSRTVQFPDEQYASLLTDLAYNDELGLYDRSKISV